MKMRLRQVALVAHDLASAEAAIEDRLRLEPCFRDPGVAAFGLVNVLYPIGDKLLEVVSPSREGTTAGRFLERRGGDSGYMVLLQVDDLDEMRRRLDDAGARVVFEAKGEGVTGLHVHPRDVGGAILSLDETRDWSAWPWAGPSWRDHVRSDFVSDLSAVEIEAVDPQATAARWARVLGTRVEGDAIHLDEGALRFVVAGDRGEGVSGIDLVAAGDTARQVDICGTKVRIAPG